MKKVLLFMLVLSLSLSAGLSEAVSEKLTIGVMQGPTGFSASGLNAKYDLQVFPSPNEVIAKLINGDLDLAVLPANSVASLSNRGVDIMALATVGEGMLSMIGSDSDSKEVYVPGAGGTPDHMAKLLFPELEENISVTAPAQLAQLLIAGKVKKAILPQPFVTLVLSKAPSIKVLDDIQQKWEELTGLSSYPMSILVSAKKDLDYETIMEDYKASVEWVLSNPEEAGKRIEELGIMAAGTASSAIPYCALVFSSGDQACQEFTEYCKVLSELDPKAIGGKLPELSIWYR